MTRRYKEIEEDMPLSATKIQDVTLWSCHRYRLLSSSISFSLLLSSICFFASCTGGTFYHSYKPLPKEGWDRGDTVCFDLPKAEKDIDGKLYIGLRTTANVSYQEVVLAVEQRLEKPYAYRCDTVHYPLTDAEGFALTDDESLAVTPGVNHHQYENQHLPFHLQKGQNGSVRIHHLMRHEVFPDITELGIKLTTPN